MSVKLQFVGDISLDGLYCCPQNHGKFAQNCADIGRILGECDYRIANWEAPIAGNGEYNGTKRIRLATTRETAECIVPLALNIATLANNHVFDCADSGFLHTVEFFRHHGIMHVGAGLTRDEATRPLTFAKNGISFVLLNYASRQSCPPLPESGEMHLNFVCDESSVLNEIRLWKLKTDHVVVAIHWGHRDHLECPPPGLRTFGKSMIEAGASLVYGGQFHMLMGHEFWRNGCILYAIGNYCFSPVGISDGDEFWASPAQTKEVGVASVEFEKTAISSVAWKYLRQPLNSLLLVDDPSPRRRRRHSARMAQFRSSQGTYRRMYQLNALKWDIIDNVSARGGYWQTLKAIRLKQINKLIAGIFLRVLGGK